MNDEADRSWKEAQAGVAHDFPGGAVVQRTRLGNVAAVQELYSLSRYGIALSDLWPRLNEVIPKDTRERVEEANIYRDFTVIMSMLSIVGACLAVVAAFSEPRPARYLRILGAVGLLVSAVVFYRLAVEATPRSECKCLWPSICTASS